jgi:hypothetical protein
VKDPKEEMIRPTHPRGLISDLTDEERKLVEKQIEQMPLMFRECEDCLRAYQANEATVLSLLITMFSMFQALREFGRDLAEKHNKPKSEGTQVCKKLLDTVTELQSHSMTTEDMIFRKKATDAYFLAREIYLDSLERS